MICPVCQNIKTEFFLKAQNTHGHLKLSGENFIILKCSACGVIFPRLKADKYFFRKYYPTNYYRPGGFLWQLFQKTFQLVSLTELRLIVSRFIKKGQVLDFGCGQGEFLASLHSGWEKFGVEVNPKAISFIKRNLPQIKVIRDLSIFESKKIKFDLITLWHVLEHVENSKKLLSRVVKLLKKNGIIILSTPNSHSLGLKIGGNHWFHLDTPRHLAIFNLASLTKVLDEVKLEIIKIRGNLFVYPLDLFWSVYNRLRKRGWHYNFLLASFILPLSLLTKIAYLFWPERSEVITIVASKIKRHKK